MIIIASHDWCRGDMHGWLSLILFCIDFVVLIRVIFYYFCFWMVFGVRFWVLWCFKTCFVISLWKLSRLVRIFMIIFRVNVPFFWFRFHVSIFVLGLSCSILCMTCSICCYHLSLASLPSVVSLDLHRHLLTFIIEISLFIALHCFLYL